MGKAWRHEHEVTGHITPVLTKERDERCCPAPILFIQPGPQPRVALPTSARNLLMDMPAGVFPWWLSFLPDPHPKSCWQPRSSIALVIASLLAVTLSYCSFGYSLWEYLFSFNGGDFLAWNVQTVYYPRFLFHLANNLLLLMLSQHPLLSPLM